MDRGRKIIALDRFRRRIRRYRLWISSTGVEWFGPLKHLLGIGVKGQGQSCRGLFGILILERAGFHSHGGGGWINTQHSNSAYENRLLLYSLKERSWLMSHVGLGVSSGMR
jgi:hypothetical protein